MAFSLPKQSRAAVSFMIATGEPACPARKNRDRREMACHRFEVGWRNIINEDRLDWLFRMAFRKGEAPRSRALHWAHATKGG